MEEINSKELLKFYSAMKVVDILTVRPICLNIKNKHNTSSRNNVFRIVLNKIGFYNITKIYRSLTY